MTQAEGVSSIHEKVYESRFGYVSELQKMGANITVIAPATIVIVGGTPLSSIEHTIMCDRLEAGSLLIAAAATKGSIFFNCSLFKILFQLSINSL